MDHEKAYTTHVEVHHDDSPVYCTPEEAQIAAMSPEEYDRFEKKLLRKMDIRIIPWIVYVYTTAQ